MNIVTIIQRSIPFPPIRIEKIITYLKYVYDKDIVNTEELKKNNIDFGRGRGDITRFLNSINIVELEGSKVRLSKIGKILVEIYNNSKIMFKILLNNYLYDRVIQYRILIDILRENSKIDIETLYRKVNENIKHISPSTWINKVAYRTLINFSIDLEVIKKDGKYLTYLGHRDLINNIMKDFSTKIGDEIYIDIKGLSNKLGINHEFLEKYIEQHVEKVKCPNIDFKLIKVKDVDKIIDKICSLRIEHVMKFSSTER